MVVGEGRRHGRVTGREMEVDRERERERERERDERERDQLLVVLEGKLKNASLTCREGWWRRGRGGGGGGCS